MLFDKAVPNFGYAISTEELNPSQSIEVAKQADEMGYDFLFLSDHFHPWVNAQGQSPFVWSVIGAIAQVTKNIKVGTGVTSPILRYHPAIVAQAAATSNVMLDGRFILGLGTGENLNEHVVGHGWPAYDIRIEMMVEAIEIIKLLLKGGMQSYYGEYYTIDHAQIFTITQSPPPIIISAFGPKSAKIAGLMGDGFISTKPDAKLVNAYEAAEGKDKPKYALLHVCYDTNEEVALDKAFKLWPTSGLKGHLNTELKLPTDFEAAVKPLRKEDIAKDIITGADAQKYVDFIQKYLDAGYDHIYINEIGQNQYEFMKFYTDKLIPNFK